jgi:hypothetical protein
MWYDGPLTFSDPNLARQPEFETWLDANADALARFRRAAGDPRAAGALERDAEGGLWQADVADLPSYSLLARLAIGSAIAACADGHYAEAADTLVDALAAGRRVGRGATLRESLVGLGVQSLADEGLQQVFALAPEGTIDYAALAERLAAASPEPRAAREILAAEHARVLDGVQRAFQRDPDTGSYALDVPNLRSWLGEDADSTDPAFWSRLADVKYDDTVRAVNEYYAALGALADQPWPAAREHVAQLVQARKAAHNPLLEVAAAKSERYGQFRARGAALREGTVLVARLKAYHEQHGRYPAALSELGAATVDPVSGQPFVYRPAGDDFVLYSVGDNGVDDGGAAGRYGQTQDWVLWPPSE